ncbi:hypothetical protein Tco_0724818 [Tanacetum coccineum]|uniref:Uncharacterized protein n=1 Tax=Tanacetum coccineum TaxID=301880 RepID=A0ABQ4YDI7_9ASTR
MNLVKMKQGWKKVLKAASKHLSSAEKDLGSTTVLNDASLLHSSVARERFHDDRYDCLFRQSGSVETQCELPSYSREQKIKCSDSFQRPVRSCVADRCLPAHGMVIANRLPSPTIARHQLPSPTVIKV